MHARGGGVRRVRRHRRHRRQPQRRAVCHVVRRLVMHAVQCGEQRPAENGRHGRGARQLARQAL